MYQVVNIIIFAVNMMVLTVFMSSSAQASRDYKSDQTEKTKRTDIFLF